ncbi:hypothetical protein L915_16500 [Phytophthora nicotianae]|uniref:Uncharacterized protein n=1 Tax=Phytophthora nicotianae TaxID=4792 RepID=W2G4T8_PHYNI|nr:hypothetical protein L915_16500 [Phytophthora nicotianae]
MGDITVAVGSLAVERMPAPSARTIPVKPILDALTDRRTNAKQQSCGVHGQCPPGIAELQRRVMIRGVRGQCLAGAFGVVFPRHRSVAPTDRAQAIEKGPRRATVAHRPRSEASPASSRGVPC